ncbi:hypothetical protein LXA55_18040, partial [Erwinia amylovora]|uniref:hypothetical protein n=1 Tax=Erwinia amylovora TaxID=552 RepID=UPI0020C0D32D
NRTERRATILFFIAISLSLAFKHTEISKAMIYAAGRKNEQSIFRRMHVQFTVLRVHAGPRRTQRIAILDQQGGELMRLFSSHGAYP